MAKQFIGLMDSGVGGLSVLAEFKKLMPDNNYLYYGDTKNVPYGTKTPDEIFSFTRDILEYFLSRGIQNVAFACNTTSAVAYERLKEYFNNKLNIFPLIQIAAPNAIKGLKDDDTIAVLATRATVNSKKYSNEIKKINPNINVVEIDCTGFVEIVENRLYEDSASIELIKEKLKLAQNAKRIILGCTHYPYLTNIFKKFLDVEYFNPAKCLAEVVQSNIDFSGNGEVEFVVSNNPKEFKLSAKTFFEVKKVTLRN